MKALSFPLLFLFACSDKENGTAETSTPVWSTLQCTMLHSTFTGEELLQEIDEYESLSEKRDVEITVGFYDWYGEDSSLWWEGEVVTTQDGFTLVSSEIIEDGWVDIYDNPLSTVVWEMDLTTSLELDDELFLFFNEDGKLAFEEGQDAWFHIGTVPDEEDVIYSGMSMWLIGFGWEEDYGTCNLLP